MYNCMEHTKIEEVPMVNMMRLSSEDRIAMLEQEIMMLCKKQIFDGVEITQTAPKHYKAKEVPTEAPQASSSCTTPSGSTESSSNGPLMSEANQGPVHPFYPRNSICSTIDMQLCSSCRERQRQRASLSYHCTDSEYENS